MKKILFVFPLVLFLVSTVVFADSSLPGPGDTSNPNPPATNITLINPLGGGNSDISSVINNVMQWLIMAGSPIAALMVVVGGIQILTSGGEPEKFKKGRQTILYTAIGYGIILVGSGIISIVEKILTG